MRRPIPTRLSKALFALLLAASLPASAADPHARYIYECHFTGHAGETEKELFNFPLLTPTRAKPKDAKVEESNRATVLKLTLTYDGRVTLAYTDDETHANLGGFRGKFQGVNPSHGEYGKFERGFPVTRAHSQPYTSYKLRCQ